jgi:predicted transcriptional regulator
MSDKQLALESIQRLPDDVSLDAIADRLEFLAGIRKGLDQVERGETMSHEEVKKQFGNGLAKWRGRGRLPVGKSTDDYLRITRDGSGD